MIAQTYPLTILVQPTGDIVIGGSYTAASTSTADDSIVVGGTVDVPTDAGYPVQEFGIVRFTAARALDTTFGTNGRYLTVPPTATNGAGYFAQAVLANGDMVAVGNGGVTNEAGTGVSSDMGLIVQYACP